MQHADNGEYRLVCKLKDKTLFQNILDKILANLVKLGKIPMKVANMFLLHIKLYRQQLWDIPSIKQS